MHIQRILFLSLTLSIGLGFCACTVSDYTLVTGSYTDQTDAKGLNVYRLNAKTLDAQLFSQTRVDNPSYFTFSPDGSKLYVASENDTNSYVSAYTFDENVYRLSPLGAPVKVRDNPCYIAIHPVNPILVTANYSSASISFMRLSSQTGELMTVYSTCYFGGHGKDSVRQEAPHPHCVTFTPDGIQLFATDLGKDAIYSFVDPSDIPEVIAVGDTTPGTLPQGPRHLIFTKDSQRAYLINELSGNVMLFNQQDGKLTLVQTVEADSLHAGGSADIRLSPDEQFLYVSNRLQGDGIVSFKVNKADGTLSRLAFTPTEKHPRNFRITPDGKLVLVACKDGNCIQILKRDKKTGMLTDTGKKIVIDSPVCVVVR